MNKTEWLKIRCSSEELKFYKEKYQAYNRTIKVPVSFSDYIRRKLRLGF